MKRELTRIRPVFAVTAAALAVAAGAAGCGSSGSAGGATASPGTSVSTKQALSGKTPSGKTPANPLAKSRLKVLTTLKQAQLCSVVSPAEAVAILRTPVGAPVYASHPGVAISCQWTKAGAGALSSKQLCVAIPAATDWTGTKAVDRVLHSRPVRIDGHQALAGRRRGKVVWSQVDVALGGARDPIADFRAPTMSGALALARMATPHILALG